MKISSVGYLVKEGLKNVWSNRMMSFASIGVLISCLLLTGAAILFSMNVNSVMRSIEDENTVTVYLKQEVTTLEAVKIGQEIQQLPNVKDTQFVSADEGLQQYEEMLGPLFEGLEEEENFLPHSWIITMEDLSQYDQTVDQIRQIDGVDTIRDRRDSAMKLTSLNQLVTQVGFWVILALGIISLFIISNTIRVTMFSRRLEISIMKSVGATNSFIRIPFIVEGVVIGLISAIISTILLRLLYNSLISGMNQIVPFTGISFDNVAMPIILGYDIAGVVFGALGGLISIRKYLKKDGGDSIGW